MNYNQNFNMQYQPPVSLQTPEQKQTGMFLHLSGLLDAFAFPVGLVVAVILWQTQKDKTPALDAHGKMVVNWAISSLIYAVASLFLMFVLIGFFTILAVWVMCIVFPIVGAIRANNGEFWEYPLTIKFLK